jgi:uncharacterized protein (DUF2236 family)
MDCFVHPDSIVRKIWGRADTILFIFAGAAAEFALNKAVDWLFFTGKLPHDPLGRLFSTVTYARNIVFSDVDTAHKVIDRMALIHHEVERKRGSSIPDWAYRDVLYMLIDYSIRSYNLFNGPLNRHGQEEVYAVFRRVGTRMGVQSLPDDYGSWIHDRSVHLERDLEHTAFTEKLFLQYRKNLGWYRYEILLAGQGVIVPEKVREMLQLKRSPVAVAALAGYRGLALLRLDWLIKSLILPKEYIKQVRALEGA